MTTAQPFAWYMPSWNGDLRLETAKEDDKTLLSIVRPTPAEVKVLGEMKTQFVDKDWIKEADWKSPAKWRKRTVTINAPLTEVGALAQKLMKPGGAVMTAVVFENGEVRTHCRAVNVDSDEDNAQVADVVKDAKDAGATAAATVKRATPCCPQCIPGAIGPANEVLQAFLTDEQHETWAEDRTIHVVGGRSGVNYMLAHRHSRTGQQVGRICYDLDHEEVIHFHDWTVPPEEEVLAAKLILESPEAEPWLRNEATCFGSEGYKNPFGSGMDGVIDSVFTQGVGNALAAQG